METPEVSSPILPGYIWHQRVHEELGEHLHFWRLAFSPVYPRDSALAGLREALSRRHVKSVAVYELLGPFDVLVRVWLPSDCDARDFQAALLEELEPHGLDMCDVFGVDYVVQHWAFEEKNGSDEPRVQYVRDLIDDEDKVNALETGNLGFRDVEDLRDKHLVATPSFDNPDLPGIKFALSVTGSSPDQPDNGRATGLDNARPRLQGDDRRDFQDLVTRVVADAKSIQSRSLYAGVGFGHFVILGRVSYKKFHDIHGKLVTQLGSTRLQDRFRVSTVTMISGQRGMRLFSERLFRAPFVVPTPSGTTDLDLENLSPGTEVISGRFRIEESLGNGGFGAVYRVSDIVEREMTWALKLFPATSTQAAKREMAMLRKVSNEDGEYVVRMIWGDRDADTGWWYLVSEYIEGATLDTYVRGDKAGELTDDQSLDVVRQILLGLEACHPKDTRMDELARLAESRTLEEDEWDEWKELKDQGIIHRDIKPLNVMLTPRGRVKLIDFNIASPAGEVRKTTTNTPSYAPPDGWPDAVWAPRVDLFGVAVILFELLCNGRHPYPEECVEPIDPAEYRPDLPPDLLDLLRNACTVSGCYSRAVDMREDLERIWAQQNGSE